MACIDPTIWQQAVTACNAIQSVHGLGVVRGGYVPTGPRALRGLGAFSALTNLFGAANAAASAPTPPTGYNASTLNIPAPPAGSMNDPCSIANQAPCASQGTCPAGYTAVSVGIGMTNCAKNPPSLTAAVPRPAPATTPMTATMTPATTAGFSHWGLLAALAVGGFVVYKVATHKKASS